MTMKLHAHAPSDVFGGLLAFVRAAAECPDPARIGEGAALVFGLLDLPDSPWRMLDNAEALEALGEVGAGLCLHALTRRLWSGRFVDPSALDALREGMLERGLFARVRACARERAELSSERGPLVWAPFASGDLNADGQPEGAADDLRAWHVSAHTAAAEALAIGDDCIIAADLSPPSCLWSDGRLFLGVGANLRAARLWPVDLRRLAANEADVSIDPDGTTHVDE